ncbi:MAG: hypothetical protein A2Y97_04235 [Nitrospirae bacterium RBG_13_39_12]|nr:MAG: hypothetical protein A2Y97_04235 [Nitrospirae bacterium RBG_13_39_12]
MKELVCSHEKRTFLIIPALAIFSKLKGIREIDFITRLTGKKQPFNKMRAFHAGTCFLHALFLSKADSIRYPKSSYSSVGNCLFLLSVLFVQGADFFAFLIKEVYDS